MATLLSNSSGNFSSASTWSLVDATSFSNSEAGVTNTTTTFVNSASFTPGPITIDALAIKVSTRITVAVGTLTVQLAQAGVAVAGTTVVINISDINGNNGSFNNGWLTLKLAAPVLLIGALPYTVQVRTSTAATLTLYRTATAGDWSRALRTTTTQAPAAADTLLIAGDYVSAGVNNPYTVTMDNTSSATSYGVVEIAGAGTLTYGISAATNYYLKLAGNLITYSNGTLKIGTAASPIPVGSAGKLEFACTSNVQFGLEARVGAIINTGGAVLTFNKANLAADAAVSATSLTTDVSTGWKTGDVIAIAATTRTKTECESKALTGNASGTTLTITALTNAHGGVSPVIAELINLTRNVQIFGTSTTFQSYVNIASTATVDFQSTEFFNLGSATANKRGIDLATSTTGSAVINNCSIHDNTVASSLGIFCNSTTNANITVSNTNMYNITSVCLTTTATTATNNVFNNIVMILGGASCAVFNDLNTTITNITCVGGTTRGMLLAETGTSTTGDFSSTISGLVAHSNTGPGIDFTGLINFGNNSLATFSTLTSWRNTTFGITLSTTYGALLDTINLFGNATANVTMTVRSGDIQIRNMVSNAGTTLTCPIGIVFSDDTKDFYIDNSTFGVTSQHATGDINIGAFPIFAYVNLRNCIANSTTPVANFVNLTQTAQISFSRFQQTSGNHRTYKKFGIIIPDTTIFNNNSPSERITPNNATNKMWSSFKKIAIPTGQTATVNVYLRKSVVGDGTAYNGNQLRLIQKADAATGNNVDTVLATTDNTYNGTFKILSAVIPAVTDNCGVTLYVDADGTTGWVNIDDWSVNS